MYCIVFKIFHQDTVIYKVINPLFINVCPEFKFYMVCSSLNFASINPVHQDLSFGSGGGGGWLNGNNGHSMD